MVRKKIIKKENPDELELTVTNLNTLLSFLSERNIKYISPEGEAYLDGLKLADYEFKFVSIERYNKLEKEIEDLKHKLDIEKNRKKRLFF